MKAIMLEAGDEYGEMKWYAVITNSTPEDAISYYAKRSGIPIEKVTVTDNAVVLNDDDAIAYEIELLDRKTL